MRTDKYSCSHTLNPDLNVFKGLSESTKRWFMNADGHELEMKDGYPPKMTAVYSSSALCVNVFQYFIDKIDNPELSSALFQSCKLIGQTDKLEVAKMQFECTKYPIKIGDNTISTPNIDLVAELTTKIFCQANTTLIKIYGQIWTYSIYIRHLILTTLMR